MVTGIDILQIDGLYRRVDHGWTIRSQNVLTNNHGPAPRDGLQLLRRGNDERV